MWDDREMCKVGRKRGLCNIRGLGGNYAALGSSWHLGKKDIYIGAEIETFCMLQFPLKGGQLIKLCTFVKKKIAEVKLGLFQDERVSHQALACPRKDTVQGQKEAKKSRTKKIRCRLAPR